MLALAFDPAVPTADDAMAARILDAALALAAASGLRHLTMDDVARRAGVGRMTVYRRFGSRKALVDALAVREGPPLSRSRSLTRFHPEAPIDDRKLADLFVATLRVIREHLMLQRLARLEPEALVLELTRDDSAVFKLVLDFLQGLIGAGQAAGDIPAGDPALLAEIGLRLGASFVLMPDSVLPLDDEQATTEAAIRRGYSRRCWLCA